MSTPADRIAAKIEAKYRALHDRFALPDTCTVIRHTEVSDGRGGTTTTETALPPVRCSVDPAGITGEETLAGAVELVNRPYEITLPYEADVTEGDLIACNGRRFEVENVRRGEGYGIATEITAREV